MKKIVDKISDSEAEVMKAVWSADSYPVTYAQIRTTLSQKFNWESQTINTLVKRLVKKNILKQEKREIYYYSPLVSEADYQEAKTATFIEHVYGNNIKGLLSALISYDKVTEKDFEELKDFWEKGRGADE